MNINKDENNFHGHLKFEIAIWDNSMQQATIGEKDSIKTIKVVTISSHIHVTYNGLSVQMKDYTNLNTSVNFRRWGIVANLMH